MLGAGVMFVDRRARRPHRRVAAREGRGPGARREPARGCSASSMFFFRMPFNLFHTDMVVLVARSRAARDRAVGRVDDERGQPHRRARRAGGRHRRDRAAARCSCSPTGCSSRTTSTATTSARSSRSSRSACASASCRSTGIPAKIIMGDAGALFLGVLLAVPTITIGGRTDLAFSGNTFFFFGPLAHPGADPRRADPRHRVLVPPPPGQAPALAPGRRRPPPPPADAARPRPAAHGRDPLGVDRAAVGRRARARPTRRRATRSCRSWSPRSRCCCSPWFHPGIRVAPGAAANGPRHPTGGATADGRRRPRASAAASGPEQTRPSGTRFSRDSVINPPLRFDSSRILTIDCE